MTEQLQNYTVKELAQVIDTAEETIRKKIRKHKFHTIQEMVNSRLVTVVQLTPEQLESLIFEINANRSKFSGNSDRSPNSHQPGTDHSQNVHRIDSEQPQNHNIATFEQINVLDKMLNEIKEANRETKEEKDKLIKHLEQANNEKKLENDALKKQIEELQKIVSGLKTENEKLKKNPLTWFIK